MQHKVGTCSAEHFKYLYTSGVHRKEIAQECNCAVQTVKNRASLMKLSRDIINTEHKQQKEDDMVTVKKDLKHLKETKVGRYNQKKYKEALETIEYLEESLEVFNAISIPPKKRIIKKLKRKHDVSYQTVIAVASDWHVDEIVRPETIQYLNEYNPTIATRRANNFFRKIVLMTERNRHDTTIENLVLILGGDFISGNIHEELLENTSMQPIDAILFAQDLIQSGLDYLKKYGKFKRIVVICKDGNHSRITQKMRNATRRGNSLEWGMYCNLAKRNVDMDWILEEGYLTYFTVYDKVIRIHHGDAIRYLGGVGGLEIPMKRGYMQWNMTKHADLNIMGHYHSYMAGDNLVNGSLIGFNAYAYNNKFPYNKPIQAFLLIDQKLGVANHSPLYVD